LGFEVTVSNMGIAQEYGRERRKIRRKTKKLQASVYQAA